MSVDREEIRWKLQMMSEIASSVLVEHENQRKVVEDGWEAEMKAWMESRNTILTGIGFAIGIWLTLISIKIVDVKDVWYILIGIVAGGGIYFGLNGYMVKSTLNLVPVLTLYEEQVDELLKLKGWILGRSMRDDVTMEHITLMMLFISAISEAISYELRQIAHTKLKTPKPDQEKFRKGYADAKSNFDKFHAVGLKEYGSRIESFIQEFEKNDIQKTTHVS